MNNIISSAIPPCIVGTSQVNFKLSVSYVPHYCTLVVGNFLALSTLESIFLPNKKPTLYFFVAVVGEFSLFNMELDIM